MTLITRQADLDAFCRSLADAEFVTVDTEFMRDSTYWPRLCLVQVAGPEQAAAIDPLADGLDLAPFWSLLADESILKVMHAARQDVEIFQHDGRTMPKPVFDTQVAAMVCGFGESVGYETLVVSLAGQRLDKASRFANWAQRPLTDRQLEYALADVTHLRHVYTALRDRLAETGRSHWVEEEDAVLTDPATYDLDPERAWLRLKTRSDSPRFLAILKTVAAWREREAQRRDVPRAWVVRDETLLDIAAQAPATPEALSRSRGIPRGFAEGRLGRELLAAIAEGQAIPHEECPAPPRRRELQPGLAPVVDLLRVLLKAKCETHGVAQKLVAGGDDLEAIASGDDESVKPLHGWRREVFGEDALALRDGSVALALHDRRVALVPLDGASAASDGMTVIPSRRRSGGRRGRRARGGATPGAASP